MSKKMKYMADGGIVGADGMTEAQRAKRNAALSSLGMSTAPAPVQPAQAAPLPQAPVQQPPVQAQDRPRGIFGIVGGRQQQIDKAAGYACGGKIKAHAQGGKISGPGTPTSDSIPAVVEDTGEQIRVANKERIVSQAQDQFLESVARQMGFDSLDAMLEAGTGKPVGPTIKGGKRAARYGANGEWIPDEIPKETNLSPLAGQTQAAVTPIAANQGRGVMDTPIGASFEKSIANFKAGVPQGSEITARPDVSAQQAASATGAQQTNPLVSGIQNTSPFVVAKERFPISVEGGQFITGSKPGEMPSSAQGGFTQDGKSYNVNQTSQPGISRVTAPGTSPLYTNIKPEDAVAGLKNQMIGGDEASVKEGIDRHARANKARGEMINNMIAANGGNGIAVLPDSTRSAASSDIQIPRGMKSPRRVAEFIKGMAAIKAQERGQEIQADTAALQNQTARYGHDINAQRAAGHDAVIARGQDLTAANDAERNRIMESQASRKGILAPIAVSGGEVANPNDPSGVAKIKLPNAIFDPNTGKWHTQPQANEKAATTKEEVQAALATGKISKDEIKKRLTSAGLNPNDYL